MPAGSDGTPHQARFDASSRRLRSTVSGDTTTDSSSVLVSLSPPAARAVSGKRCSVGSEYANRNRAASEALDLVDAGDSAHRSCGIVSVSRSMRFDAAGGQVDDESSAAFPADSGASRLRERTEGVRVPC